MYFKIKKTPSGKYKGYLYKRTRFFKKKLFSTTECADKAYVEFVLINVKHLEAFRRHVKS